MSTRYGKAVEVQRINREADAIASLESDPYRFSGIEKKSDFYEHKRRITKAKESITPPPCDKGEEIAKLEARANQLEDFMVNAAPEAKKPEMPTRAEMAESPAGSVGKHIRWEQGVQKYTVNEQGKVVPSSYGAVHEWKDIKRRLAGQDGLMDPDVSNVETFRPTRRDHSSFSDYRRLSFAQGQHLPQSQWDNTVGTYEPPAVPEGYVRIDPNPDKRLKGNRDPNSICIANKKDGTRCNRYKVGDSQYCLSHKDKITAPEAE